ncbi:hypothetical protein I3760_08G047800 [Carya illinoinensis]|nr:hypothetical protein I3760_08G047800 [Carya illinoinensis]
MHEPCLMHKAHKTPVFHTRQKPIWPKNTSFPKNTPKVTFGRQKYIWPPKVHLAQYLARSPSGPISRQKSIWPTPKVPFGLINHYPILTVCTMTSPRVIRTPWLQCHTVEYHHACDT